MEAEGKVVASVVTCSWEASVLTWQWHMLLLGRTAPWCSNPSSGFDAFDSLSLNFLICKMGAVTMPTYLLYLFISLFIYFERDRDSVSGGGAEREGERESQAGSKLSAQSPECRARTHETTSS